MKLETSSVLVFPLYPCHAAIVLLFWPCVGVSLIIGETAFTLSFLVSELNKFNRKTL